MRTLKYAILGLLTRENLSGYDLTARFQSSLNEFWTAKHSQIYPELKKLLDEGLVEYKVEISGTVLERKVYSITQAGRAEFHSWLSACEPMETIPKDVFRLRMFFADSISPSEQLQIIQHELRQHRVRLRYLEGNLELYCSVPANGTPEFGDYLVLTGAVMREKTSVEWLEKCMELIQNGAE